MRRHVRRPWKEFQLLKRRHNASVEDVNDNRILTEAREKWKVEHQRYMKSVIEAKRTHWQNYVSSQTRNKMDPLGGVYKFLMGSRGPTYLMAVEVDGRISDSWQDAAAALIQTFFGLVRW
ncbi:hypothetical protein Zmor_004062 [Zophobas morio]|uniref:Uncharacterized protein n=1 Tax=Zophobas morio TaxID=2755281 RepID=A0AA38HM99_9CUCU|nr:hypothetical protein Zmor_004062 [Zophobas morio]